MPARSSLTRTAFSTITSAWANSLRDHVVPYSGSDDVSTEGQLSVNTTSDRVMVHNGSGARRLIHYGPGGRSGVSATATAVAVGAGVTAQIPFSTLTDPDSYYTGWNGSAYVFTVPTNLDGVYAITVNVVSSVSLTAGGVSVSVASGGLIYPCLSSPPTNYGAVSVASLPLVSGNTFSVAVRNEHSASSNFDVRVFAYRLFA